MGGGGSGGAAGAGGATALLGLGLATICGLGSSQTLHFFAAAVLINVHRGQPQRYSLCGSRVGTHSPAGAAAAPSLEEAFLEGVPGSKPPDGDAALGGVVASSLAVAGPAAADSAAASAGRSLRFLGFKGGSPSHPEWQRSPQPPAQ